MVTTEDFDVFFNCREFATEAVMRGQRIVGLEGHSTVMSNEVETQKTFFTCPSSAILGVAQGERIFLRDQPYRVVGIQQDGTGLTVLLLECLEECIFK